MINIGMLHQLIRLGGRALFDDRSVEKAVMRGEQIAVLPFVIRMLRLVGIAHPFGAQQRARAPRNEDGEQQQRPACPTQSISRAAFGPDAFGYRRHFDNFFAQIGWLGLGSRLCRRRLSPRYSLAFLLGTSCHDNLRGIMRAARRGVHSQLFTARAVDNFPL